MTKLFARLGTAGSVALAAGLIFTLVAGAAFLTLMIPNTVSIATAAGVELGIDTWSCGIQGGEPGSVDQCDTELDGGLTAAFSDLQDTSVPKAKHTFSNPNAVNICLTYTGLDANAEILPVVTFRLSTDPADWSVPGGMSDNIKVEWPMTGTTHTQSYDYPAIELLFDYDVGDDGVCP